MRTRLSPMPDMVDSPYVYVYVYESPVDVYSDVPVLAPVPDIIVDPMDSMVPCGIGMSSGTGGPVCP